MRARGKISSLNQQANRLEREVCLLMAKYAGIRNSLGRSGLHRMVFDQVLQMLYIVNKAVADTGQKDAITLHDLLCCLRLNVSRVVTELLWNREALENALERIEALEQENATKENLLSEAEEKLQKLYTSSLRESD